MKYYIVVPKNMEYGEKGTPKKFDSIVDARKYAYRRSAKNGQAAQILSGTDDRRYTKGKVKYAYTESYGWVINVDGEVRWKIMRPAGPRAFKRIDRENPHHQVRSVQDMEIVEYLLNRDGTLGPARIKEAYRDYAYIN